jgi:alpha-1,2-mannosyltransferase
VASAACEAHRDFERRMHRILWISSILFVIGAAIVYAEKAAEDRSAFIRWRHQVLQLMQGVNIYDTVMYPNPPIMPLTLYPLMVLPPVVGALCWYALKVVLTAASAWMCFEMVRPADRKIPAWVRGTILLVSLRPILSDLHHGNNNLVILFLVVASLQAWRKGYDVLAGLTLALSISYKVTPALFVAYFLYKRSWRTVVATCSSSRAWRWASSSMRNAWRCGGIGS